jgi:isoprenylcysteine carboxyl methyltransferase (ICMT) family protein YpbQ
VAVAPLGLLGSTQTKTAGTTIALTNSTGAIIPAGTLVHITGCWDNIASVTAPTVTCSTVGGGTATANHATAIGSGVTTTAGSGVWHTCFRALTTASIAIGGAIATLTSDQSAVARAASAQGWSGATSTLRGTVTTGTSTTGAPTVTTTGTALVVGDLVIGSVSFENSAQMTADADTAGGSWSSIIGVFSTGAGAATNVGTGAQSKVVTATGTQTFNPTNGVADTVACIYSVQPAPAPLITQAAYRFYADGTETAATALAAQNTSYTADLSSGDVNLGVRLQLQSTNASTVLSTDDFTLQWEKNASGTWADVATLVVDSYPQSNRDNSNTIDSARPAMGQSFLGNGRKLAKARFMLSQGAGFPPNGAISAALWTHTGTFGSGGLPATAVGSPVTTSAVGVSDASTLPTTATWYDFIFDQSVTLTNGTPYFIGAVTTSTIGSPNSALLGADLSSPTHAGNAAYWNGSWIVAGSYDVIFEVYGDGVISTVAPYDSANLTDSAATTNQLTGGTGTFTSGQVSEDGTVDNLGWAGNNYTELLFSITLKQADLANGDTLRFRVRDSNTEPVFTYSQVPTIPITVGAGTPTVTATLSTTWNTRAAAARTLAQSWNVRAVAAKTLAQSWNVRVSQGVTLAQSWNVLAAAVTVSQTLVSTWAVRAAAGSTVATSWNARENSTATLSQTWNVRATVAKTLGQIWNVRVVVVPPTVNQNWKVRAVAATTLGQSWNVRVAVGTTVAQTWNVRAAQGKTLAQTWAVRAIAGATLPATWNVRAYAVAVLSQTWKVRVLQGATLPQTWAVRAVQGTTLQQNWSVRFAQAVTLAQTWNVRSLSSSVVAQLALTWNVRAQVVQSLAPTWNVRVQLAPVLIAQTWNVRAVAAKTVLQSWNVRAAAGQTLPALWNVRALTGSTLVLTWRVRTQTAPISLAQTWNVRAVAAKTLLELWSVRAYAVTVIPQSWKARVAKTVTTNQLWVVRVARVVTLAQSWNVLQGAAGRPKIWTGTAWVTAPMKVWTGTVWIEYPVKYWDGAAWQTVTA